MAEPLPAAKKSRPLTRERLAMAVATLLSIPAGYGLTQLSASKTAAANSLDATAPTKPFEIDQVEAQAAQQVGNNISHQKAVKFIMGVAMGQEHGSSYTIVDPFEVSLDGLTMLGGFTPPSDSDPQMLTFYNAATAQLWNGDQTSLQDIAKAARHNVTFPVADTPQTDQYSVSYDAAHPVGSNHQPITDSHGLPTMVGDLTIDYTQIN